MIRPTAGEMIAAPASAAGRELVHAEHEGEVARDAPFFVLQLSGSVDALPGGGGA